MESPAKKRRLSLMRAGIPASGNTTEDTQLCGSIVNGGCKEPALDSDENITISSTSKFAGQTVAPFLAKHIPEQYAPLGGSDRSTGLHEDPNTKYCYRHRPDLKCRRQANEPSMDQLQHVCVGFYLALWKLTSL